MDALNDRVVASFETSHGVVLVLEVDGKYFTGYVNSDDDVDEPVMYDSKAEAVVAAVRWLATLSCADTPRAESTVT